MKLYTHQDNILVVFSAHSLHTLIWRANSIGRLYQGPIRNQHLAVNLAKVGQLSSMPYFHNSTISLTSLVLLYKVWVGKFTTDDVLWCVDSIFIVPLFNLFRLLNNLADCPEQTMFLYDLLRDLRTIVYKESAYNGRLSRHKSRDNAGLKTFLI